MPPPLPRGISRIISILDKSVKAVIPPALRITSEIVVIFSLALLIFIGLLIDWLINLISSSAIFSRDWKLLNSSNLLKITKNFEKLLKSVKNR